MYVCTYVHQGSLKNWDQPGGCHQPTGGAHIHAMHAGGKFGTLVARLKVQVCQGQLSFPFFQGRYMSGGDSQASPRALNLGAIAASQGATMVELW